MSVCEYYEQFTNYPDYCRGNDTQNYYFVSGIYAEKIGLSKQSNLTNKENDYGEVAQ